MIKRYDKSDNKKQIKNVSNHNTVIITLQQSIYLDIDIKLYKGKKCSHTTNNYKDNDDNENNDKNIRNNNSKQEQH